MAEITSSIGGGYAHSFNYVWNIDTLEAVRMTQPGTSEGGGGDASAANQVTGNASLASIDGKLTSVAVTNTGTFATQASQSGTWNIGTVTTITGPVPVTGTFWQVTQPVSGTVAVTNANLDAAISTLATSAKQPALGQALAAASTPVVLTAAQVTTLTPPAALVGFALEAGHLAAIDTSTAKIPSQGQALAAASLPVVLTAAQVVTLTPPAAIAGFGLESTQLLQATAAKQDTQQASLDTLTLAQGAASASKTGPMVQAIVSESPESFADGTLQPLSLTSQGRLRVSTVPADIDQVWQHTNESPWDSDNPWQMESLYV